jgi:hypothetical protein
MIKYSISQYVKLMRRAYHELVRMPSVATHITPRVYKRIYCSPRDDYIVAPDTVA